MILVKGLAKSYNSERILDDLSFQIPTAQTLSILGKSGCGKSTLLKILAGQEKADKGRFELDGVDMLKQRAQRRGVVYLSQEALLFPHISVAKNLAFGLEVRKEAKAAIQNKVKKLAEQLGISPHLSKLPHQLSGGQAQRVSFGRALIIEPKVLLLDEPFASLDSQTRLEMQDLYIQIKQRFFMTALFVTHELKEALTVGDQLAIMKEGTLHMYRDKKEFINDPNSGVLSEIQFWKEMIKN